MIRVLLIEQNKLWRRALSMVISREEDIEVSSELAQVNDAIEQTTFLKKTNVGVVNIDAKSEHNNLTAVRKLKEALPSCYILAVADHTISASINPSLGNFIQGFVSRDIEPHSLVTYMRQVANGERVIEPSLAVAAACADANPFTRRERQILLGMINGQTNPDIANQLHLSVGTVRNRISLIIGKTGARNRVEAAKIIQDRGWL